MRVNAISPGVIVAPPAAGATGADAERARFAGGDDARHAGQHDRDPDAIAHAAVYLASDEARFVHGTVIDADGGRVGGSASP